MHNGLSSLQPMNARNSSSMGRTNLTLPLSNSNLLGKTMGAITALGSPTKKIDSMLKFGDGYAKQIEKQKKVLEGLCIRIDEIQVNIESYRKHKSVQPKNNADSTSMPQKIKALEYRLSTQLQKFNQAVAENKSMRERIDQLRKERVVFDMIYRQLESDIKGKREELIAIMAKTDKAEKARDESRTELDKLKVESSKLKELFQNEWNEVVEKSLKEQNETTFSLGEKDKAAEAIKVVAIKEETTTSITKSGKKDKNAKNSSERKGDTTNKAPGHHVDPEANTYANKLRSTTARAAWAVARDTG